MDRFKLRQQLIKHEGLKLTAYRCSEGYLTIGVGFNIDGRGLNELERILGRKVEPISAGITRAEALAVLDHDIEHFEAAVRRHLGPVYDNLSEPRQRVCVDFAFNLGNRALKFHNTIAALKRGDFEATAQGMEKSLWFRQVKGRAKELVATMRTGQDAA